MILQNRGFRLTSRATVVALLVGLTGIAPELASPAQATSNTYAGVSGLISRFTPAGLNVVADTWTDEADANNILSSASSTVSASLIKYDSLNDAEVNGSTASFNTVSGTTSDYVKFPTLLDGGGDDGDHNYTVYYVARYSSSDLTKQKRILSDYLGIHNFAAGFHASKIRMFYINSWIDDCNELVSTCPSEPNSPAWVSSATDWIIIGFKYSRPFPANGNGVMDFRVNGGFAGRSYENFYRNNYVQMGINAGPFGIASETPEISDFEIADYMLFNKALSDSDMSIVEVALAKQYGIPLQGSDPTAPSISQPTISASSFPVSWSAPAAPGAGELYKYQVRLNDVSKSGVWEYADVAGNDLNYDFIQDRNMVLFQDAAFNVQVRAITTTGVSPWSDSKSVSYAVNVPEIVIPPQAPSIVEAPAAPAAPAAVSADLRSTQTVASFASSVKKGKSIKLPMTSQQGVGLSYSSSKGCKVSKVYKTKTVKVGKKKKMVKIQTGWLLLGQKKKAVCTVRVSAPETATANGLTIQRAVKVK